MTINTQIAICGAGPVGLLTALKFAQSGLDVTIIEADPVLNDTPRACVFAPASLEGFDTIGILGDVKEISHTNRNINFVSPAYDWKLRLSVPEEAGPYGKTLHVGQEKIGEILLKHLQKYKNVQILWSHRLTAFNQDEKQVTMEVDTKDGPQRIIADWLIGADGANSTSRVLADIEFKGHTWPARFFATNVTYDFEKLGYGDGAMMMDPHKYAVIVRVNPNGIWRIAFGEDNTLPSENCVERAKLRLHEFIPQGETYEITRLSPYSIHQRAGETLRKGRFILAGDAAHATNPVGGLGLTTGIWDALILGDILPAVIKGDVSDDALDAYSEARLKVFWERTSPMATENKRLIQERDPEKRSADIARLEMMSKSPQIKAMLPMQSFLTVGDPVLANSPWQKYKDLPMPPKPGA